MRGTTLIATVAALAALTLGAGCGAQPGSGHAASGPASAAQPGCVIPKLTEPGGTFSISEKDDGKSFCLAPGTGIFVFLHGTSADMWARIRSSSAAVAPRPSGEMMLVRGTTGGYFAAAGLGVATLLSTRSPCHAVISQVTPGGTGCTSRTLFLVTVLIRSRM